MSYCTVCGNGTDQFDRTKIKGKRCEGCGVRKVSLVDKLFHNKAENVCEHGDHPAPPGKRFCSDACYVCELESNPETGCDGICGIAARELRFIPSTAGQKYARN